MNKLAMPTDEMVESGMTPHAREAYRARLKKWRDEQASAEENKK